LKLSGKQRAVLPIGDFGLPDERKYPMPDREHAVLAIGRATQMQNKGKLAPAKAAKIKAKARRKLGEA
jgi:hypothetical protein